MQELIPESVYAGSINCELSSALSMKFDISEEGNLLGFNQDYNTFAASELYIYEFKEEVALKKNKGGKKAEAVASESGSYESIEEIE